MGTNYFARINGCGSCGRYDEVHICKSLHDFEAVITYDYHSGDEEILVSTWREWKLYLRSHTSTERELRGEFIIWDEYGTPYAVVDFIKRVEALHAEHPDAAEGYQWKWLQEHSPERCSDVPAVDKSWIDPEGYLFAGYSFS